MFSYLGKQSCSKPALGPLRKSDNTYTSNDQEAANCLNEAFSSVFVKDGDAITCPAGPTEEYSITSTMTAKLLGQLDINKAVGPDGIPSIFWKECCEQLGVPLAFIINNSLNSGDIPADFKKACVTPIYKGGSRLDALNYRPISLICVASKVVERVILNLLQSELDQLGYKDSCQHGFVRKRSCATNLLTARNDWTKALNNGDSVDVIFFDFSKALDSVCHDLLVKKLIDIGLSVILTRWITSYLTGQKQCVVANASALNGLTLTREFHKEPYMDLFSLFTSDIQKGIISWLLKYADDLNLYGIIRNILDTQILQQGINLITDWARK